MNHLLAIAIFLHLVNNSGKVKTGISRASSGQVHSPSAQNFLYFIVGLANLKYTDRSWVLDLCNQPIQIDDGKQAHIGTDEEEKNL